MWVATFPQGGVAGDGARGDEFLEADVHVAREVLEGELCVGARAGGIWNVCYEWIYYLWEAH